ncbi:hypothetical protein GX50_07961 [[Emmonsia] crescens]|uniref:Uncharacterized protein n=1 Tax=[Emmonsia] crescens TaxID=73230 RepID=A0A2B7Z7V0_9EURO|nr:hypothetical protein GX50_07961 [Emmonsia crescens]
MARKHWEDGLTVVRSTVINQDESLYGHSIIELKNKLRITGANLEPLFSTASMALPSPHTLGLSTAAAFALWSRYFPVDTKISSNEGLLCLSSIGSGGLPALPMQVSSPEWKLRT